jgi:uncharacterized membrane protein YkoI
MNFVKPYGKRILIPSAAAAAVIGIGGFTWAAADTDLVGDERDRVGKAATEAAGGGTVVEAETSDDLGGGYEVEVRKDDGTEVDVSLDKNLDVLSREAEDVDDVDDVDDSDDDADDADDGDGGDGDDRDGDDDRDERALSAAEIASAGDAATAAVGGGTVTDVDAADDGRKGYEVEVLGTDNTEWDVDLDADFNVVAKAPDD